jgi:hypothetical protein
MLFRERVAVYCENHKGHTNTLRGQNAEFMGVKAGGTYYNKFAQSIKLVSQKPPLLDKHVQINMRPKIQRGVFYAVDAKTVARQHPMRQWTDWVAINWEPQHATKREVSNLRQ